MYEVLIYIIASFLPFFPVQNEKHETVGSETDAYSIADMMSVSFIMNYVPILLLLPHQGWGMIFLFELLFCNFLFN